MTACPAGTGPAMTDDTTENVTEDIMRHAVPGPGDEPPAETKTSPRRRLWTPAAGPRQGHSPGRARLSRRARVVGEVPVSRLDRAARFRGPVASTGLPVRRPIRVMPGDRTRLQVTGTDGGEVTVTTRPTRIPGRGPAA